jgi:hypothetical protein
MCEPQRSEAVGQQRLAAARHRSFGMPGKTSEDGYLRIGEGMRRTYQNARPGPGRTRLSFRTNDGRMSRQYG